jgi:hypothetical protein
MKRPHFRFEDLEIWQLAKELAVCFLKVADNLGKIGGEDEGRIKNNGFAVARGDVDFRILETPVMYDSINP